MERFQTSLAAGSTGKFGLGVGGFAVGVELSVGGREVYVAVTTGGSGLGVAVGGKGVGVEGSEGAGWQPATRKNKVVKSQMIFFIISTRMAARVSLIVIYTSCSLNTRLFLKFFGKKVPLIPGRKIQ